MRGLRWVIAAQVLAGGLLAGTVILGASVVYAPGPPVVLCLLAGFLVAGAVQVLSGVPAEQPEPGSTPAWEPPVPPGLSDVVALEAVLRAADGDQERFDQRVRPLLAQVTVALLRQRASIDWDTDAAGRERARARLGPELWALLSPPRAGIAACRATVRTWIEGMERL